MMHFTSLTCHAICFILVQIIQTVATNGEFSGAHNISSRSKRSLFEIMPKELKIRVKYVTGEEIDLDWTKQEQYLANKYLPVITSSGYPILTAMDDVGEFVLYQDPVKCSAVVYFEKFHTLFGVIGMNYYVADLPYLFDETGKYPHVVGEPYVKKREYSPVHNHVLNLDLFPHKLVNPVSSKSYESLEPSFETYSGPSPKRQRTHRDILQKSDGILNSENITNPSHTRIRKQLAYCRRYYLEALVLVTRDVADIFKKFWGDYFIEWLVRYYIIYFNAVDMIYNKLECRVGVVLMNIAKIVIEDKETAFDSIGNNELLDNIPQYLYFHHNEYPRDSFDHIFIFTSKEIMDNSIRVNDLTKVDEDLYEARRKGDIYNAVPKTLMGFEEDYISTVHAIARTFKFEVDTWDEGYGKTRQCGHIMQEGSSKCDKCLKWHLTSKLNLEYFLRKDRNHCFLINSPRSVRPPGVTGSMAPHSQCRCFGYDSYLKSPGGRAKEKVSSSACSDPLQCIRVIEGTGHIENTIRPLDGTRCCSNPVKVCWNGECKVPTP